MTVDAKVDVNSLQMEERVYIERPKAAGQAVTVQRQATVPPKAQPRQQRVQPRNHFAFARAPRQSNADVVKRLVHVEHRPHYVAAHPQHTKAPVVGENFGRADFIDVFRRHRDANDAQRLPLAV